VTLDLNGFALVGGGGGATRGINTTTPLVNFVIRNGNVRGWADGGVRADFAVTLAEKLLLSDNIGATGLVVGNGSLVKDCVASGNATGFFCPDRTQIGNCISTVNTGAGFDCTGYVNLIDCTSSRNGGPGIVALGGCSIVRCSVSRNLPSGRGIVAGAGCTVADCTVGSNGSDGIAVGTGSTVRNCTASSNVGRGIIATASCQLTGNTCDSNKIGIEVTGNDNRVDGNSCTIDPARNGSNDGYFGFYIGGENNWVVRNTARGSFAGTLINAGFVFTDGNRDAIGPIQRTGSGEIATLSPWANFRN